MCWILTGVMIFLYEGLVNFKIVGLADVLYVITYSKFFRVTFFCHTATKEARSSSVLLQLLLKGN